MSISCDLQLDRPNGVYQAGETVNGNIYLTLPERVLLKGIALESNGYAASAWLKPQKQKQDKKGKSKHKEKPSLAYEQREDYLASVNYFVGSESAPAKIIDAGTYHFAFSVQLPANCPSSYEGTHGHIRYTLQLLLDTATERQLAHSRQLQVEKRCERRPHEDSPTTPAELQRLEHTPRMKFWQKPLLLNLNIPRGSYELGEGVSVHVQLQNPQKLPLSELIYKLNLLTTYVGHQKDKPKRRDFKVERCNILSSVHQLKGLPRSDLFQHLQLLQLPQSPPTLDVAACQCLQLSYELEVILKTTQKKRFIMAQMPLIVLAKASASELQLPVKGIGSMANLTVTRSMDDLSFAGRDAAATAPQLTPEVGTMVTSDLSVSMISLASNFREADFMVATNLNKRNKHAMSGEQLDFKPRYVYYEMHHAEAEKNL